jgi:hypothetical protein
MNVHEASYLQPKSDQAWILWHFVETRILIPVGGENK